MRFTVALASVALPLTISAYPALERDLNDTLSDVGINVQGLLTSLTPPNPNDPRFTQFQKPGPDDGEFSEHPPPSYPATCSIH